MFKRVGLAIVVLALSLMVVLPASADLPLGGWWGGIQIANLGSADATIDFTVYTSGGNYSDSASGVAPGGSANFLTLDLGGTTWRGGGVASSDQPIAAVASLTNKPLGGAGVAGGTARALYPGVSAPDTTVFFPLVKNQFAGKSTSFFVQNAGSATATFYAEFNVGGTAYTHEYAGIPQGQMTLIDPSDAGVPTGGLGSLVVTSTVPIAGVVNEYKIPAVGEPAKDLMATRGFAPADAGNKLLFPIFKNNFASKHVGIQIQNTGSIATTAYMTATETFCLGGGTPGVRTASAAINAGESATFLGTAILADRCVASVEVTADQPIVGTGSESRLFTDQFTVYFGFNADTATDTVFAPLYKQQFVDGNTSGLQVQNLSSTAASCTLTWSTVGTTNSYVYNDTIPGGSAKTYYRMDNTTDYPAGSWTGGTRVPDGTNNAVKVECDQDVVGVVQEANANPANQDAGNYESFNQ